MVYERPIMQELTYTLDGIPPSNNQFIGRNARWAYQEQKKTWAQLIFYCCRPRPQAPFSCAKVTVTYFFTDHRRRDPDNYSGKFLLDGLVSAGILKDDSFQCIELHLKANFGCQKAQTKIEVEEIKDNEVKRNR